MRQKLFTVASVISLLVWIAAIATPVTNRYGTPLVMSIGSSRELSVFWDGGLNIRVYTGFPPGKTIKSEWGDPRLMAWQSARASTERRWCGFVWAVWHDIHVDYGLVSNGPRPGRMQETDRGLNRQFGLPWWFAFGAPLVLPGLWSWATLRTRNNHGVCATCSYDLTGNTSGVCPECGSAVVRKAGV